MKTQTNTVRKQWLAAGLWALFLGAYFFVVYGMCNWVSSTKADVPIFYFSWERMIPFVPWMIVPYMSIDLFFAGSTFICRDKNELHTLISRIVFAISASAICFLLFPLKFGYARPEIHGFVAKLFIPLNLHDLPFNLAPSLHISLRWIVWSIYERNARGRWRQMLNIWFFLIAASTLLVYQHHVIDVIAGDCMAFLCFYLFPYEKTEHAESSISYLKASNRPISLRYFLGALAFALIACFNFPGHLLLFWPAFAGLVVAMGYVENRVEVFQKKNGRIPILIRVALAPYFVSARLLHLYSRRFNSPFCRIGESVLLGRKLSSRDAKGLVAENVAAVLDMTAEFSEAKTFLKLPYRNIRVLDWTPPTQQQLQEAVAFIREHGKRGRVYVHCALGLSRGACVVAAWLLAEGLTPNVEGALDMIRQIRPGIVLPRSFVAALETFHFRRTDPNSSSALSAMEFAAL
jgi:protein-tyrosine phosphatase